MGKRVFFLFACVALVLMVAEASMAAQSWIDTIGRAIGKEVGKQVAAEMGAEALRTLMRENDNFRALVESLEAGRDVCNEMDNEYGPGTCSNVISRLNLRRK